MRRLRHHALCALLLVGVGLSPAVQPRTGQAEQPAGAASYVWLDADGRPLPFQDHATIQEAIRSARVVSREKVGRGVAGVEKLLLEYQGVSFHAAFRTVDVSVRPSSSGGATPPTLKYRDAAVFESAAYQLSELLGIGRVPPVVERRIDNTYGTVQIWMEATLPEVELIQQDRLKPPDTVRWNQQKQIMRVFDSLIANRDRNQGNLLIDESWGLWFIDHTRAFLPSSKLMNTTDPDRCERRLWEALRSIDDDTVRARLEPYLEEREISYLLRRRANLVRHIEKLIAKRGEAAVLFDLRPAGPERAAWSE